MVNPIDAFIQKRAELQSQIRELESLRDRVAIGGRLLMDNIPLHTTAYLPSNDIKAAICREMDATLVSLRAKLVTLESKVVISGNL